MIDGFVRFLESLLRFNRSAELLIIDVIAALSPWLAPVLPAYLTGRNLFVLMNFPWQIAVISAAVVELVGLSSMSTVLMLWTWNEEKRESDQAAPVWLALLAGVIYLSVVLSVNTLLDIDPVRYGILVKGLLSCLTVVAALIIAVRGQHARRQAAREQEKADRKEERRARLMQSQMDTERKVPETFGNFQNDSEHIDWRYIPENERVEMAEKTPVQIRAKYGVSERVSHLWAERAKQYKNNHREHLSEN